MTSRGAILGLLFFLTCTTAAQPTDVRAGHGLIGYGISMYDPLCAYSCRAAIATSKLDCSDNVEELAANDEAYDITSPECYATDDAFLRTLAYCIASHCHELPVWTIERYWQANVAGHRADRPLPKASYQQTLSDLEPPNDTLTTGDMLLTTMVVPLEEYETNYNTQSVLEHVEQNHETFGYASSRFLSQLFVCQVQDTMSIRDSIRQSCFIENQHVYAHYHLCLECYLAN